MLCTVLQGSIRRFTLESVLRRTNLALQEPPGTFDMLRYDLLAASSTPRLQPGRYSLLSSSNRRSVPKHQPGSLELWQARRVESSTSRISKAASECAKGLPVSMRYCIKYLLPGPSTLHRVAVRSSTFIAKAEYSN